MTGEAVPNTYNLDSSTCVDIIRNKNPKPRKLFERALLHAHKVVISEVVLHELAYGADKSDDPTRSRAVLKDFLVGVDVLDFDSQDAMTAGAIRSALGKKGMTIGAYDTLIAGQALARKHVMVTGNGKEFSRVIGLRIADWGKS